MRLANWSWRHDSRSLCDALQATLQSTKLHYRQQGHVCKAGTGITVDVSSEERTSDLPGRWRIWRQRSHSLCWPVGWCFKSREAWTVRSVDEVLAGLKSILLLSRLYTQTSFLAIHCPYYRHKCRVHKGGTESELSSFYVALKKSEEFILCFWWKNTNTRLYQCALMKNAPSWGFPSIYSAQNYVDWGFRDFLVLEKTFLWWL